ncbi:diguanylate cyclase domain-containing protein [Motilibacter peucedani]|uniref:diguanylate cyclase domain-containing protein n=1 Tax=Motilibacter peucedani TaxID=598650 RepID=UPI0011C37695|nr:diguanylate cyclase [Motilibacter peucedani]
MDSGFDRVFRTLVETAPMAILLVVDGQIAYANSTAEQTLGVGPGEAEGLAAETLVHPDHLEVARHRARELLAGRPLAGSAEIAVVRPDGQVVRVEEVSSTVEVGGRRGIYVMACDVTERARREAHFAHLATHDGLTGLPNRLLLQDRLEQALARVGRGVAAVLLLFVDLDGFKGVNDQLGHAAGDAVLVQVGERLRGAVRTMDTVARLSGDEFVVVAELELLELADSVRERLDTALAPAYEIDGARVEVGASIGQLVLDTPRSAQEALVEADRRMYAAKPSRTLRP